jgi:hypothetical protein
MKTFKEYLEEGQAEMTNAMNNIPAEKRDSARKQYTALRKKGHTHAAAMTYMFNLHKEEIELQEMGDTTKGKSTLANYIKKRSAEVASDAAHDALHAGTNIKTDDKTVYGLDPVTKQPITKKPRPRFAEHKKLTGIARAADRLAK